VFALFVEWMYYGAYSISTALALNDADQSVNMDLQCWVLGDKLLCIEFKNYAMHRIYQRYTGGFGICVITTHEVEYVCTRTSFESKLMQFFCAVVVTHFADSTRLKGTTEVWDQLVLEHADLRKFLLERFRTVPDARQHVRAEEEYMDVEFDEAGALSGGIAKSHLGVSG
jgi:hypothetical protein